MKTPLVKSPDGIPNLGHTNTHTAVALNKLKENVP